MSYVNALKSLRSKMLQQSTGRDIEVPETIDSFIPSRMPQQPQETTEDLLTKNANWLSEIKKASYEFKKAYEDLKSQAPSKSPLESFTNAFVKGSEPAPSTEEAETPKEAFIRRRADSSPSTYAPKRGTEIGSVLDAIAAVESRGSGDYKAVGPVVQKGMYKGQRAYGRYQVMEGNIAPWSKEALGRTITLKEFMDSPEIQDAIASYQLQKAKNRYGTWEDAASVWFSGRPVSQAGNASDGYTTVPEYIQKFRRNLR